MKKLIFAIGLLTFITSLLHSAQKEVKIVPWPQSVTLSEGTLRLKNGDPISVSDQSLLPLANIFSEEIFLAFKVQLKPEVSKSSPGGIELKLSNDIKEDEGYQLHILNKKAIVTAKTYRGISWGTASLLQSLEFDATGLKAAAMKVEDHPNAEFRALLVDVARQWHPIESLRPIIQMCRLYKINYLQLHLTDDQSFTFPSSAYPKLKTFQRKNRKLTIRRHYTMEELTALVKYADERGVTIIPEFEGPGHSGAMRKAMPELFKREKTSVINLASEKTYAALDVLVGEMCEVFKSSPYFHIGADEAWLKGVGKTDEEKDFMKKHGLSKGATGLYNHYIVRLNNIVKKYGKKTIVWEGFHGVGGGGVTIPKDILVMPFESTYNPPHRLAKHGFTLINTAWRPLYVVGGRKWPAWHIYKDWNMRLWMHQNHNTHIQLKETDPVIGAMMCAWEQSAAKELPSIRPRLHAMSERIWNPNAGKSFEHFEQRAQQSDQLLSSILAEVKLELIGGTDRYSFDEKASLQCTSTTDGVIRYTLDDTEPNQNSPAYHNPITLSHEHVIKTVKNRHGQTKPFNKVVIRARLFHKNGNPKSDVETRKEFRIFKPKAIVRTYERQRLNKTSRGQYASIPDEGEKGLALPNGKGKEVSWFPPIETVVWPNIDTGYSSGSAWRGALWSEGHFQVNTEGSYTFTYNGNGRIIINGETVYDAANKEREPHQIILKPGKHHIKLGLWEQKRFGKKVTFSLKLKGKDQVVQGEVSQLMLPLDKSLVEKHTTITLK